MRQSLVKRLVWGELQCISREGLLTILVCQDENDSADIGIKVKHIYNNPDYNWEEIWKGRLTAVNQFY